MMKLEGALFPWRFRLMVALLGLMVAAICWRAALSARTKSRMRSAVPSSTQRVASAAQSGEGMTETARSACPSAKPACGSGATA